MMARLRTVLLTTTIILCGQTIVNLAQETRETAVAKMRALDPKELDPTYHGQAPYAQWLVDQALARNPAAILIGMHVVPPGSSNNVIIASNFARIGKLADKDDLHVINTGESNFDIEPSGKMFEAEIPLRSHKDKIIGAVSIVFNYKEGDDKAKLSLQARRIVSDMNQQIPSTEKLFGPAPAR
jgi:hypothetical protein